MWPWPAPISASSSRSAFGLALSNFTGLSTPLREAYLLKKLRLPVCHNEKLSFTGVHSSISGMKAYGISRQIDSAYNPVIDPWDSLNTRDEGAIAVRSYPSCHCDLDIF
jgi:hypothetical protein